MAAAVFASNLHFARDTGYFDGADGAAESLGSTTDPAGAAALLRAIGALAASLPPGTRIILLGNSPTAWAAGPLLEGGWLRCRAYRNVSCPASYPAAKAEGRATSALLRDFAARDPRFIYVDAAAPLCPGGRCRVIQNGKLNYWDGSHLTTAAAVRVIAQIDPALLRR